MQLNYNEKNVNMCYTVIFFKQIKSDQIEVLNSAKITFVLKNGYIEV